MRSTISLVMAGLLLSSTLGGPALADDLQRLFGTIAGEIIREQMRQPQQAQPQRTQPQTQRREPSASQPQRQTAPRQPRPQQPQMSLDERMAVQRALGAAGHYAGAIDGILGAGSRRAIAEWQTAMGAAATGYLVPGQVRTLVGLAPPAAAAPVPAQLATPGPVTPVPQTFVAPIPPADPVAPPIPATPLPPSDAIVGDDALNDALMIWAAATRPELLDDPILPFTLARDVLAIEDKRAGMVDPAQRLAAVRAALPGPDAPAPARAILERPVNVRPAWNGEPAGFQTPFAEVEGISKITGIDLEMKRRHAGSKPWTMKVAKPFFLPGPPGFEAWAIPHGDRTELVLQLDVSLSDHAPIVGEFADSRYRGGTATATVNRVSLIRRPPAPRRTGDARLPDEVLHVWTGEAPATTGAQRPADPEALAMLYGGAASGGRFVADAYSSAALGDHQLRLSQRDWGMQPDDLAMALAVRRVAEAAPDRLPDVALTEALARTHLSPRERMDLFPVEIAQRPPGAEISELTLHAEMTKNAGAVRDIVATRAPDLPLPMRWIGETHLGEYDFAVQGFPINLGGGLYQNLPLAGPLPDIAMNTVLAMHPAAAQALLDRMAAVNPSGASGRQIFVGIDYVLEAMTPRAPGNGPVTAAELGTLTPQARVESAALFLDAALTEKLLDLPVPEAAPAPAAAGADGPGEALFATTGLSLWGAFVRADTTGEITEAMFAQDHRFWPPGGQPGAARAAALADQMRAAAQDEYWIGLAFTPSEYDPATQRLQIGDVRFRPVPYDNDISGREPPPLVPADPRDYAALIVTPDEAGQIAALAGARGGIAAYALVRPVAAIEDAEVHGFALAISPPDQLLIGPDGGGGLPQAVALRIAAPETAPAVEAVAVPDPVAPDTLVLDQEGADLLALAADPQVYDDAAWTRMMMERLMRERWHALEGDPARGPLPWGAFFADPSLTPDAGGVAARLAAFKAWTQRRVAALPGLITVPWGEVPQIGPNCKGVRDVLAAETGGSHIPLVAQAAALAAGDATPAADPMNHSDRPRPGEDRLFLHESAPAHRSCRYPRQVGEGDLAALIPPGAGHVSAIVGARAVPNPGPRQPSQVGTAVVLRRDTLRLVRAGEVADAPEGLIGVVVAAGPVEAVTPWQRDGRSYRQDTALTPPDWALPTAPVLAASDVVGLTLGMPLAEFEAAARAHLGEAMLFQPEAPGQGLFGHARGLLNLQTGEALAAVHAPGAKGQPVIAIMRRLPLEEGQADPAALQKSLVGKYGPVSREAFAGAWLWGTLPENEDGWRVCGGESLLGRPERDQAPRLRPTGDLGQPEGSYLNRPDYWFEAGWPEVVADRPGLLDPSRCGPVVGAMVAPGGNGAPMLQVWLMDRKLAQDMDVPAEPVVEAADIKL